MVTRTLTLAGASGRPVGTSGPGAVSTPSLLGCLSAFLGRLGGQAALDMLIWLPGSEVLPVPSVLRAAAFALAVDRIVARAIAGEHLAVPIALIDHVAHGDQRAGPAHFVGTVRVLGLEKSHLVPQGLEKGRGAHRPTPLCCWRDRTPSAQAGPTADQPPLQCITPQ